MSEQRFYPIGTPGQAWGEAEKAQWLAAREIQRSYRDEVLTRLESFVVEHEGWELARYGALSIDPDRYPLICVRTRDADPELPWVLITGGVHGYETSGVQGAIAFLREAAADFAGRVNFLVAPCVSPWGYEVINRWNPRALDPNRNFVAQSPVEESAALWDLVRAHEQKTGRGFLMHMDLHETTDSDEDEFRPALAAREGQAFEPGIIPDGFYTVADESNPQPEFQAAIIAAVREVTHIAPPDDAGQIIGADVTQDGVIHYDFKPLGLCAGLTDATYTTTTEVYPDSPKATPEICNAAQVAAVRGGLGYALARG